MPPKKPVDPDWAKEVANVRPLGAKAPPTPALPKMPQATGTPVTAPLRVKEDYLSITGWYDAKPIPIFSNTAECIAGAAPEMEKSLFRKLSKGEILPQSVIDLHGLGEGDALMELVGFLHESVVKDNRCVLVIHGKGTGYGAAQNMWVIKYQIGNWLAIHPKVLAFHTALPRDGGTGAIYVYLRRYGHSAS